ncbi:MAG: DUF4232 domain-containing protein [Acidobacteriota bacterium]|nr:DUF4232 domain-containing protein [Acidobacteriota bacterium]
MTETLLRTSALAIAVAGVIPATATATVGCTGGRLAGSFTAIPGTHAPAEVAYALTVTNTSQRACTLSGRLALRLLGANGAPLPTRASPTAGATAVTLPPLASASAVALLSVDVPGPGDVRKPGHPCEPLAVRVIVEAASGSTLTVPLAPPASVCSRGAIAYHPLLALERQAIPRALLELIHSVITLPVYEYTLSMRVDRSDPAWVEWSFGPAGPTFQVQGGIAFAHLTGGRWRDVAGPGSAGVCSGVPAAVLRGLGMSGC